MTTALRVATAALAAAVAAGAVLFAQTPPAPPDVSLPAGEAARGKAIFEGSKGNCLSCHRVNGAGSLFGPDLSAIALAPPAGAGRGGGAAPAAGQRRAAALPGGVAAGPGAPQFAQSILEPNAVVSVQNRYVLLKMKDGRTISGKLLNLDTFGVQIFDSTEKLANISREDVREMTMTSPMPSYRDKLTTQELADVIAYLMSLRGQ